MDLCKRENINLSVIQATLFGQRVLKLYNGGYKSMQNQETVTGKCHDQKKGRKKRTKEIGNVDRCSLDKL